jgi:hypothetical protein
VKKSIYLLVILLCITLLPVSGCDFLDSLSNISCESSAKVEVAVKVHALVAGTGYKESGQSYEGLFEGIKVKFEISKTDGDSFTQYRTSNAKGITGETNVGYNLRKGQTITVTATTTGTGTPVSKTITLDYKRVRPIDAERGETEQFTWEQEIELRMPPFDPDLYPSKTTAAP